MKKTLIVSALLGASCLTSLANAEPAKATGPGEIIAGKMLAKSKCAGCHGAESTGNQEGLPDLAGKSEAYLVEQLKAFRIGYRNNLMMTPAATSLTDKEIIELAAYYASLKK
ncbi:MAG: cytochrome c [Gammaproteobacteria bacterium]|nr:MAG: cytochrome c [Gammaproteobacteria bacterium]RLA24590.1 MAG: cytochrome c [Gammaproteobacteria bacterium]